MLLFRSSFRMTVVLLIFTVIPAGCTTQAYIAPTELNTLNTLKETDGWGRPTGSLTQLSGGQIEVSYRTAVEITAESRVVHFDPPILVDLDKKKKSLLIRGSEGGESFQISSIDRVKVIEYDDKLPRLLGVSFLTIGIMVLIAPLAGSK